jgi:hypothetical protein
MKVMAKVSIVVIALTTLVIACGSPAAAPSPSGSLEAKPMEQAPSAA